MSLLSLEQAQQVNISICIVSITNAYLELNNLKFKNTINV